MKHSLTVVTLLTLAAVALLAMHRWAGSQPAGNAAASDEGKSGKTDEKARQVGNLPPGDGNALIARAASEVKKLPTLEAKLRLQTNMLGQELAGSGTYYQLVRSPDTLFKLELKLQVASQVSSLLHVSDGRFLWTRRDLPTQKFLGRVDQRRINAALAKRKAPPAVGTDALALGGLGHLLETLGNHFQFGPLREDNLAGAPVWTLQGNWKPAALAALWPEKAQALSSGEKINLAELPEQIPSHVIVVLSRDPALPYFPQRIDYQRAGENGANHSLVSFELFDVRRSRALDPRLFDYKPGDQEVVDQTEDYLRMLGAQ